MARVPRVGPVLGVFSERRRRVAVRSFSMATIEQKRAPWAESPAWAVRPWAAEPVAWRTCAARKEMGHGPKVTGHGPHRTVSVSGFYRSCFICFLSNFWTNFFQFFYSNLSNKKFVLENGKVTEIFQKSIKIMKFLFHVFPLQIEKRAPFKFKRSKELKVNWNLRGAC